MEVLGKSRPLVIWITGLPGSGKTTLARNLKIHLKSRGLEVIHLDGDQLRVALNAETVLDLEGRKSLANSYQKLSKLLSDQGFIIVVSTVSLFSEVFTKNREMFSNYFEVFLNVNQNLLESGPRKMQYAEPKNVYTKNILPEFPPNPDLTLLAKDSCDRDQWFEIAISKVNILLDKNV
jgi:adenylylsulfate kinase-like enzyme